MSARRVATLALLTLMVFGERAAYVAVRPLLELHIAFGSPGYSAPVVGWEWFLVDVLLMPLVGGLLAFVTGPRAAAAMAAFVATLGYGMLARTDYASVGWCFVVGAGVGMFRPCTWAIAAGELSRERPLAPGAPPPLSPRRFLLVGTIAVVLYAAIDAGGFIADLASRSAWDTKATFQGASIAVALVAVFGLVVAVLPVFERERLGAGYTIEHPYRRPGGAGDGGTAARSPALAGVALLFAAALPYEVGIAVAPAGPFAGSDTWRSFVNPVVVLIGCGACTAALVTIILRRQPFTLVRLLGAALAVFAIGAVLQSLAVSSGSTSLRAIGDAFAALAEPGVAAVGVTYASLAFRPRASAFVVAAWISLGSAAAAAGSSMGGALNSSMPSFLASLGVLSAAAGALVLVFGARMHSAFFIASRAASPPEAAERPCLYPRLGEAKSLAEGEAGGRLAAAGGEGARKRPT